MTDERILQQLQLLAGRIGKAKERIDTAESELNKIIQEVKNKQSQGEE